MFNRRGKKGLFNYCRVTFPIPTRGRKEQGGLEAHEGCKIVPSLGTAVALSLLSLELPCDWPAGQTPKKFHTAKNAVLFLEKPFLKTLHPSGLLSN